MERPWRAEPGDVHLHPEGRGAGRAAHPGARVRPHHPEPGAGASHVLRGRHFSELGQHEVFQTDAPGKGRALYRLLHGGVGEPLGRKSDRRKSDMAMTHCGTHTTGPEADYRVPSLSEMERNWDALIAADPEDGNWVIWKDEAIRAFREGREIPFYGFLGDEIICEATARLVHNPEGDYELLIDDHTAYLKAFRTKEAYRGKGYFSGLMAFMTEELKRRGYTAATLGVEPKELNNRRMYFHFGFTEYLSDGHAVYPDGTQIDVEYYRKQL
ncbi:MAG: hypothetical protein CW338_01675 [Clostridiales bacterium]|nr:hypothetical protein [Clostridiales bacterium]